MYLCNMAVDTPKQAIGHIDSSKRHGVTSEELLNVGVLVRDIAAMYDVKLSNWETIMEQAELDDSSQQNPYELE